MKGVSFETVVIKRYRRRESLVEQIPIVYRTRKSELSNERQKRIADSINAHI